MGTATITRAPRRAARTASHWPLVAVGCVALGALSLLAARQTTYDPTAWLIWGREIVHGELSTTGGPSWKPLPVFVTAPTSLLGDVAQQQAWLVVARAGGLLALALTFRLAWRLGGWIAGVVAVCGLGASTGFVSYVMRGQSEGLLTALALGAVEGHLVGRRWTAFALIAATALLRPEMLLFAGVYGLWLLRHAPGGERRKRVAALAAGAVVVIVTLWLIPEKIGSGELLRAASRARAPVPGTPAEAAHPFVATFTNAAPALPWPLYVGGVALVLAALAEAPRTRPVALPLALAGIATTLMVAVAAMAQGGFTGNSRYLTVPIALTCVLGGAGWAALYRTVRAHVPARSTPAVALLGIAIGAAIVAREVPKVRDEIRSALHENAVYAALPDAIARAGGRAAVMRCPPLYTAWYDTQAVARDVRVHEQQVRITSRPPGTIFARRGTSLARDRRFAVLALNDQWVIGASCRG